MDKLTHLQSLLLKWIKHYNTCSHEQIRTTSRSLCISYKVDERYALLKLLYPLLRMGLVEFVGEGTYQIAPPLIITYPQKHIAVGINLTNTQKNNLSGIPYEEDLFGTIRFTTTGIDIKATPQILKCRYSQYDPVTPYVHFPTIKEIIISYEKSYPQTGKLQFYNINKHKWDFRQTDTGICRTTTDSLIHYLKIKNEYFKIPINTENPEGRPLAESYLASFERNNIFNYNKSTQQLTVNNLNLPILIERLLRLHSFYKKEAIVSAGNFQVCYPDIPLTTVKQLNRIFTTNTEITDGQPH